MLGVLAPAPPTLSRLLVVDGSLGSVPDPVELNGVALAGPAVRPDGGDLIRHGTRAAARSDDAGRGSGVRDGGGGEHAVGRAPRRCCGAGARNLRQCRAGRK